MNLQKASEETDAVTAPIFQFGAGLLQLDFNAEPDEVSCWQVVEVVASDTGVTISPLIKESILARGLWPNERDLSRNQLVHHRDQGRVVNSTCGYRLRLRGSYEIDTAVTYSPHATTPIIIPEVVVTVPDPLAGYERYVDPNWDCYGAEPILAQTVEAARQLLDMLPGSLGEPHISPGSDGTIGFEWVFADGPLRKLFIDVGPGRMWAGYWRRASGERQTLLPKPIDARTEAELAGLFDELRA